MQEHQRQQAEGTDEEGFDGGIGEAPCRCAGEGEEEDGGEGGEARVLEALVAVPADGLILQAHGRRTVALA